MDRSRFSRIAHGDMPFWNPVAPAVLDAWIRELPLTPESRVVEIGCGPGELALRIGACHGCRVDAHDQDLAAIERARQELQHREGVSGVAFHCGAFLADAHLEPSPDLIVCIGSSQAIGAPLEALRRLARDLRQGCHLLFGDGTWKRPPAQEYLDFLGASRDDMPTHTGYLDEAEQLGLDVVRSHEVSLEEWDRYEGTYARNANDFVCANPGDEDCAAILARIGPWTAAYERWGRDTLGFSLLLMARS